MKKADIKVGKTILFQESAYPSMVAWHIGAIKIDQTKDVSDRKCIGGKKYWKESACVLIVFSYLF